MNKLILNLVEQSDNSYVNKTSIVPNDVYCFNHDSSKCKYRPSGYNPLEKNKPHSLSHESFGEKTIC
ncbi:MAG: hypothetical protein WA667_17010 [Candidatus Nitrosopolaris sp.]